MRQDTALVAVDWGTSRLRGARLDRQGRVLESRAFDEGILQVPAGQFESVFQRCFGDWMAAGQALGLISGMAGSRQGWREAPYCPCPADAQALAAHLLWLNPTLALVPGLHCQRAAPGASPQPGQDDVMRGEEIQIFGALELTGLEQATVILPGTHSKWARVENRQVLGFRTYMTGELYALLSQHSILARTIDPNSELHEPTFIDAVRAAQQGPGLLAHLFGNRTSALFNRLLTEQLASHLSGLVIGEELRAAGPVPGPRLLVGSAALTARYALALRAVGQDCQVLTDEATWAGHAALARSLAQHGGPA